MEDATLIWFWVLSVSDELQMTAREVKDTCSDSLSASLTLRMFFWAGCFLSSVHFTSLSATSLLLSASSPFHLPVGDQKVKERAAPLSRPCELQRKGFGQQWHRRPLDGAFRCNICDVEQTTPVNFAGAGAGLCAGLSLASRQIGKKEPSSEMFLIKRCFFPLAYASLHQSRSQQVDWNRACSFPVL